MRTAAQRVRNTAWRRRRRAEELDRDRQGRRTCPARHCGGLLEHEVLRDGTVRTRCPRCERRLAGICQDCPQRVEGRVGLALRCRECKRRERVRAAERFKRRHPARYRAQQQRCRSRRDADPARRAHFLAVKRAWRARNQARVKMYKRKWRLDPNRPNGYSSREKYEAYHRGYRARKREHYRQLAIANYRKTHPVPHPICACGCDQPIPWDGLGRPAKWLRAHRPYARCLTPQEVLVKTTQAALRMLQRGAERIRKKLAGVDGLQQELAAIHAAMAQLEKVAGREEAQPAKRGRRGQAAA